VLDLHLPDSDGLDTLRRVRDMDAHVPIVVFTAAGDETLALACLRAGAQDHLVKGELPSLPLLRRTIRHAIERQRIAGHAADCGFGRFGKEPQP